jgi:uncharacterized membrane protein
MANFTVVKQFPSVRRGVALKSTIVGGFFILLPLLLLWGVLSQAFAIALKFAAPIAYLLSKNIYTDALRHKDLVAVLLLLGASFFCGVLLRVTFIRRVMRAVESHTLNRVPGYTLFKNIVSEAVRPESTGGFRPAMLLLSPGIQRPVYVIEDHGDGNLTVFLPAAPAAFSGMVHIASRDKVVFLDVQLGDFVKSIVQFGVGQANLLKNKARAGPQGDDESAA